MLQLAEDRPRLPLLVTGIASVAGYNAFHYFRDKYPEAVIGTRRSDNWRLAGPGIAPCDMHDVRQVRELFDRYRFASVLHCEGSCKLKSCELDPAMANRLNVLSVANLLQTLAGADAQLVHLSIDLVFSGTGRGGHVEDDPTDPVTVYGRTMAEAEQMVLSLRPQSCILRISLPMGISYSGHAGAIDWIQSRFRQQKPATLYYDEIRTPTYTDCLNRVCEAVLARRLRGLYHAGGPRRLSLFQIAQIVNRVGGYAPHFLQGCLRHEAGPIPPRAGDVSMNSDKLHQTLGFAPFDAWPSDAAFVPTHADWHRERPSGLSGSPQLLAEVLYRNPAWNSAGH